MHAYLRAIGLSEIHSRKELDVLIGDIMTHPTNKCVYQQKPNERFVEIRIKHKMKSRVVILCFFDFF